MTTKQITWISDIGDPTDRGVRYVNVAFSDGDTGFIGKKEYDTALEVHGLLTEAKDRPADFTLEDTGKKNKNDGTKWKIKAFGEYQPAPYVQGGATSQEPRSTDRFKSGRSPEHDDFIQERMDRRTALMQAVVLAPTFSPNSPPRIAALQIAEDFYTWLRQTVRTEGYSSEGPTPPTAGTGHQNHGADVQPNGTGLERAGSGQPVEGEAAGCPPHSPGVSATPNKLGRVPCVACGVYVKKGEER